MANIGARVLEIRTNRKLTQEELAELAGLHPIYVRKLESGTQNVTIQTLVAICNALGVDLFALLSDPSRRIQRRPGRPKKSR